MTNLMRHLRGPLISIVVLAMSAGIAFASHPGSFQGASRSNTTTNAEATDGPDETEAPESPDPAESADPNESAGTNDNCSTDPTNMTDQELAALGHGSYVCWAAHQPTPSGYANHGAWVSHWAHLGKGGHGAPANAGGLSHKP